MRRPGLEEKRQRVPTSSMSMPYNPAPRRSRAWSGALQAVLVACALTACADQEVGTVGYSFDRSPVYATRVSVTPANLVVGQTGADGRFSPRDRERVAAFLDRYRDSGRGAFNVTITDPNRGHAELTLGILVEIARRHGVNEDALSARYLSAGSPGVALSWTDSVAQPPVCEHEQIGDGNYQNQNSPMLGCALRRSIAAMIANPVDLDVNRNLGPSDPARMVRAVDNYRLGKKMPSEADQTIAPAPSLGQAASGG